MASRSYTPEQLARKRQIERERYRNMTPEQKAVRKERSAEASRRWYHANRAARQDYMRQRNYGLEPGEFDRMVAAQDGRCAICWGEFTKTPDVDHCHTTGKVRDILCRQCNYAAGHVRDDPAIADRLAAYLRRHQEA